MQRMAMACHFRSFILAIGIGQALWPALASNPYQVLELAEGASPLDVQLAYMDLSARYNPARHFENDTRSQFLEVVRAFEQLTDADTQEEVLATADYWSYVVKLGSDEALQRFTEFTAGDSAQLRIIFVGPSLGDRHWTIFSAAAQLYGRVRIAQVAPKSSWTFFQTLKIKHRQATLIFDPISRQSRVKDTLNGVAGEAERLLEGRIAPADKLARVQDLDADSFKSRCGGAVAMDSGVATRCRFVMLFATEAAFERGQDLTQGMRPFADGCRRLQATGQLQDKVACFWLRLSRSSDWADFIKDKLLEGKAAPTSVIALDLQNNDISLVPRAIDMHSWASTSGLKSAVSLSESLPPLPSQWRPQDAAEELLTDVLAQRFKRRWQGYLLRLEGATSWTGFLALDFEVQAAIAGAGVVAVFVLASLLRGGKSSSAAESGGPGTEAACFSALRPVVAVVLQRQPGEKLGMELDSMSSGKCFRITGIDPAGPVARRNSSEQNALWHVQAGDLLVAVTYTEDGKQRHAKGCTNMVEAIKKGGAITLGVAVQRGSALSCLQGTLCLEGQCLKDMVQFVEPVSTWADQFDAHAVEVGSVGSEMQSWNEAQARKGCCFGQRLEPGDRIVAINDSTDVRAHLAARSPKVVVARWLLASSLRSDGFEVNVERKQAEDRLGLQIRPMASGHIEVLDIMGGGLIARSNSSGGPQVLRGDRITSVNGATDEAQMNKALGAPKAAVRFERWSSSGLSARPDSGGLVRSRVDPAAAAAAAAAKALPQAVQGEKPSSGVGSFVWFVFTIIGLSAGFFAYVLIDEIKDLEGVKLPVPSTPLAPRAQRILARIHKDLYLDLAVLLIFLSVVLAFHFLWYEIGMLHNPAGRCIFRQVWVALVAAVLFGFGYSLLLTWAGGYTV